MFVKCKRQQFGRMTQIISYRNLPVYTDMMVLIIFIGFWLVIDLQTDFEAKLFVFRIILTKNNDMWGRVYLK